MSFWGAFSCVIIAFRTNIGGASTDALTLICHLHWTLPVTRACFLQITAWKPQLGFCSTKQCKSAKEISLFFSVSHGVHSLTFPTPNGAMTKKVGACELIADFLEEYTPVCCKWSSSLRRRTLGIIQRIIQSMVSPNRRRRDRSRSPQRREEGYHDHRRRRHRESEGDYGRWASKIPFWNPLTIKGICWQLLQGKEW